MTGIQKESVVKPLGIPTHTYVVNVKVDSVTLFVAIVDLAHNLSLLVVHPVMKVEIRRLRTPAHHTSCFTLLQFKRTEMTNDQNVNKLHSESQTHKHFWRHVEENSVLISNAFRDRVLSFKIFVPVQTGT